MISDNLDALGSKHAGRIWGFMSKFVVLDRFCKSLGVARAYPGRKVPRKPLPLDYFGTASKVSNFIPSSFLGVWFLVDYQILEELNPPTKVLGKFLRIWGDREASRLNYTRTAQTSSTMELGNTAEVALNLSKRLIAVVKVRNVLNIEAGLEMIALAIAISTEACGE